MSIRTFWGKVIFFAKSFFYVFGFWAKTVRRFVQILLKVSQSCLPMGTYWEQKFGSKKLFSSFSDCERKMFGFTVLRFWHNCQGSILRVVGKIERKVFEKIRFFHHFWSMSENFTDFCWFFSSELTKLHYTYPLNPFQAKWIVCKNWKFSIFFCKRAKECWSLVEIAPTELLNVHYTCPRGHPVEKGL